MEHEVEIEVKSLKTGEKVKFKVPESGTLQGVWDEAANKLREPHVAGDTFRCAEGADLSGYLAETLAQLQTQRVCPNHHYEIKGPSGGARA